MKPTNNKIMVQVDNEQKTSMRIGGSVFSSAPLFNTNYRERSPVIATVVQGNDVVHAGDVLLCHHNLFYLPSPFHLVNDIFSIPFSNVLFAKILEDGSLLPICSNLLVERLPIETLIPLPIEQQKTHKTKYKVKDGGYTRYKKGDVIFTRPDAGYTIVYIYEGIEISVVKIDSNQICGYISS
jgi:hypothetical protein